MMASIQSKDSSSLTLSTDLLFSNSLPIIFISSIVSHYFFSKYEPWPKNLFFPSILISFSIFYHQFNQSQTNSIFQALFSTLSIISTYLAFLFGSIAIYRLFFHRLCKFPGSKLHALSKWSMINDDLKGYRYIRIDLAHKKYGDIIRIGPRELSINDPSVIPQIYGAQSSCIKGPWYRGIGAGAGNTNESSVYELIDKHVHSQRRRLWNFAMASDNRSNHLISINNLVNRMIIKLKEKSTFGDDSQNSITNSGLDIGEWCSMFSFDLMGEIGFSKSFNLIETGKKSKDLNILQSAVQKAQIIGHLPYLSQILNWLPGNQMIVFKNWVKDAIETRSIEIAKDQKSKTLTQRFTFSSLQLKDQNILEEKVEEIEVEKETDNSVVISSKEKGYDVMGHLIRDHQANLDARRRSGLLTVKEDVPMREDKLMLAEGMLLCVGGSDTTSAALISILYQLVKRPDIIQDLRIEVGKVFETDLETAIGGTQIILDQMNKLKDQCPLLNAVIKESMRLYTPVLSGLQRVTPKEGLALNIKGEQIWIPGNVVLSTPPFTLNRDAKNFSPNPNEFRPERWLKPELEEKMNPSAFVPFSFGPTGCAGRELAQAEMRTFISKFILTFDLKFSKGFNESEFEKGIRDLFTLHAHYPLRLQLSLR